MVGVASQLRDLDARNPAAKRKSDYSCRSAVIG
jgi:hypothetical protein